MTFFFYGTLLDRDVIAMVLGHRLPPAAFIPARLYGRSRWRVQGGSYPVAVEDRKGHVDGAIVRGLSARDVAALSAYEGPGYRVVVVGVVVAGRRVPARVFDPIVSRLKPSRRSWDLVRWQRTDKRAFVARITEALSACRRYSRP